MQNYKKIGKNLLWFRVFPYICIKIGTNFVEDKLHSVKRSSKLDVFHSFALSLYQIN